MQFGRGAGSFQRQYPGYATADNTEPRKHVKPVERTAEEMKLTKKQKKEKAAIRDPVLIPNTPRVKPLFPGRTDAWEPIQEDESKKVLKSPVFLVDPVFTKKEKEEKRVRFNANDHGGHNQPISTSAWPIIREEVQQIFSVGPDCTCRETHKKLAESPKINWHQVPLGEGYGPVWEPLYQDVNFKMPKQQQKTCYKGDDFGGHNIPFPHPAPPKPDGGHYTDAFVDIFTIITPADVAFQGSLEMGSDPMFGGYAEPVSYGYAQPGYGYAAQPYNGGW